MEFQDKKDLRNRRETAGFISKALFLWMIPLFWKGRSKDIDIDDIDNVPEKNKSDTVSEQLLKQWDVECTKPAHGSKTKKPSLLRAFLRVFGPRYAGFIGLFMIDGWVVRIAQPIFLRLYIKSFTEDGMTSAWQCIYAAGVCLTTFFHILLHHPPAFQMCVSGMRCRVSISSLIYKKALRLSKTAEAKSSVGQIVNLISNDVARFDYNLHFIPLLVIGPIQMCIFFYLLWSEIGLAAVVGTGYVLLLSPSQYVMGKLSAKFRVEIANQTDERSRVMNEVIGAMRLIKMYAWEKPFGSLVERLRRMEVNALKKRSLLRAAFMGIFTSNFTFVPFMAILTYGLLGNDVTPDKAFFTVAIFNVMTEVMMYFVPNAAACVGELLSSISRMEEFLLMEEQEVSSNLKIQENHKGPAVLKMKNLFAKWDKTKLTLNDITFDISGNKLMMIVGPVGCSKTSLLQTLLAELPVQSGRGEIKGKLSYCSQEPWLFPGTVRQNILLGKEYNFTKYTAVLDVCALEDDLKQFAYGDSTIVGERGVALSGGQKARINLARALYQEADIYLLDDPLSAVDTHVSRHIFDKCIQSHLRSKLRVLVTHQLQYLPQADHIVVMNEGKILAQGSYSELMEQRIDFVSLLTPDEAEEDNEEGNESHRQLLKSEDGNEASNEDTVAAKVSSCGEPQQSHKETMVEGSVKAKTYWEYFKAGDSMCYISLLVSAFLTNQTIIVCNDYWLSKWTSREEERVLDRIRQQSLNITDVWSNESSILVPSANNYEYKLGDSTTDQILNDRNMIMIIYAALACTVLVLGTLRTLFYFAYTMRISSNIHNRMFQSLVRAPIRFFDVNPSGRIMNRFTKDIGALDEYLPLSMFDTIDIGHRMIGCILIIIILNYYLIFPAIILFITYRYIRLFFIRTSRSIKRIETCTRSPLYTHLASSIQGIATIRSMKAQKILMYQFDCLQDVHSATWYHFLAANSWFSTWLEIASVIFIGVVVFSFIGFSSLSTGATSSGVGLAVASLMQMMNIFQFGMRQSAEMENSMTSVERTLEYTKIESEVSRKSKKYSDKGPSNDWPSSGSIKFNDVFLSYDGGKPILRNLNFEVKPQEKIGIVGRTGAGKSSIVAALFRMTEPQGEICIDGYDISGVSLSKLRKHISIIPQDPVLFSGTIRYNLDPFESFNDDELWKVLEEVELKDLITALDYKVSEGGKNFSVGQRQLVCLGRAILRRNKILVMDEATANVDPQTDHLIQQTIRTKFADCTILTIAHRLQSVMDCDKILVLDKGAVKEYDHPHLLLQRIDSYLYRMVAETGNGTQTALRQIAEQAYQPRRKTSKM